MEKITFLAHVTKIQLGIEETYFGYSSPHRESKWDRQLPRKNLYRPYLLHRHAKLKCIKLLHYFENHELF